MPKTAIRSLRVQASQSVDLAFNMPGVIARQNHDHINHTGPAQLGQRVSRFDLEANVYRVLGELDPTNEGLLLYGSSGIRQRIGSYYLFALRNEALGASVDQMLQQRRAAWFDRHKHRTAIQALMQDLIPAVVGHLEGLRKSSKDRFDVINTEYGAGGIVKTLQTRTTIPKTTSITSNNPLTTISAKIGDNDEPIVGSINADIYEVRGGSETHVQTQKTPRTLGVPAALTSGKWVPVQGKFETQTAETTVVGVQTMDGDLQAFSHPKLENEIGYHQLMVGVLPELMRQSITNFKVSDISGIMVSELMAMDLEIRNLQLNYVHTHLVAPIDGIVTGIFKDIGETVEPGEPVMRIENDSLIFIVGRVQCQEPLWVDRAIRIRLGSVFEDGSQRDLPGYILAIRGHEADNDEWEIVARFENPVQAGRLLLPLNYSLDPDTDTFTPL